MVYSARDLLRFGAAALATLGVAIVLNAVLAVIMGMVPSSMIATALFLAIASIIAAFAFTFHGGAETIRGLPAVLMIGAFISLITAMVPQLSFDVGASVVQGSSFAQAAHLALLLAEAYLGLGIVNRYAPL